MKQKSQDRATLHQLQVVIREVFQKNPTVENYADLKDLIKFRLATLGFETPHPERLTATMNQVEAALTKAGTRPQFLRPPPRQILEEPTQIDPPWSTDRESPRSFMSLTETFLDLRSLWPALAQLPIASTAAVRPRVIRGGGVGSWDRATFNPLTGVVTRLDTPVRRARPSALRLVDPLSDS